MSPLSVVVDTRANPASDAEPTIRCSHCYKHLPQSLFPLKTRGPGRNEEWASNCQGCTAKRLERREAEKVELESQLPVLDLDSLLGVLKGYAAGEGEDCDLEARVSLEDAPAASNDETVKYLIDRIGDSLKWKFNYKDMRILKDRFSYTYTCAQDISRQKKSNKIAEPDKRRDKGKMAAFDCRGRIKVSLPKIHLLKDKSAMGRPSHADIIISHNGDHVPYCSVALPDDVKQIIIDGVEKRWNMSQVWHAIQAAHPIQAFSRDSVYHFWHNRVRSAWVRDADEMKSAREILLEAAVPNRVGPYALESIDIQMPEGLSGFAFSVPAMLDKWGDRIREIALDSAWGTNRSGYEVYALLGEAYGSGLPIGYVFLKATGEPAPHSKQDVLETFLRYFRDERRIKVIVTLSDKDWSEINAFRAVFPEAKHQLCLWHCIKAVKARLAILRRQPAHYSWEEAVKEFDFIDKNFLPLAQQPVSAPDIPVPKRPFARITIRQGLTPSSTPDNQSADPPKVPRITLRIGGKTVCLSQPRTSIPLTEQALPTNGTAGIDSESESDGEDKSGGEIEGGDGNGNGNGGGGGDEGGGGGGEGGGVSNGEGGDDGDDDGEAGKTRLAHPLSAENDEHGDLSQQIEDAIKGAERDFEEDDAPDWLLEAGETKSKDPSYQFCPAPHRSAILRLFIQHFFRHPVFPTRLGGPVLAGDIRRTAIKEMYMHCKRNGLTEVWAYMWTQWYSPTRWGLWARSTSKYLSRLRTTMTVENHWNQLKHHYLHFLHRPRLDQVIYLISTALIPDFMSYAHRLEDSYRLGRARRLTPAQKRFKKAWKAKRKAEVSGRIYQTNVELWQCNCGAQEGDSYHLCKHLVQAVPEPPISFFTEVVRRRTAPLYRHPCLRLLGEPQRAYPDPADGSITEGDDHEGLGGHDLLRTGKSGVRGTGWVGILAGTALEGLLKRKRAGPGSPADSELDNNGRQVRVRVDDAADGRARVEEDEEREECTSLKAQLLALAGAMEKGAQIIRGQVPHENITWMRGMRKALGEKWQSQLTTVLQDIDHHEKNGRATTWPRNAKEQRASRHTLGFQLQSTRSSSPAEAENPDSEMED
ncbi:hypothetical protein FRC00_008347 [Tulasnella sp. 408]|nr:hypothetical protein FRC00_008347 [Tulasnella sp. 408]